MDGPIVIIPVRMASSRFPDKPLYQINGESLLYWCYQDVLKSKAEAIYVATPDQRIVDEIKSNWPNFPEQNIILTSPDCRNGTERVAEAIRILNVPMDTIVVNCQGDQFGFSDGTFIDGPARVIAQGVCKIATVVSPLRAGDMDRCHVVKALIHIQPEGHAMVHQFTREVPLAYNFPVYRHVGVYVAKAGKFLQYEKLPVPPEENEQSLEQLRWKEKIGAYFIKDVPHVFDVPGEQA